MAMSHTNSLRKSFSELETVLNSSQKAAIEWQALLTSYNFYSDKPNSSLGMNVLKNSFEAFKNHFLPKNSAHSQVNNSPNALTEGIEKFAKSLDAIKPEKSLAKLAQSQGKFAQSKSKALTTLAGNNGVLSNKAVQNAGADSGTKKREVVGSSAPTVSNNPAPRKKIKLANTNTISILLRNAKK
ncbi:MAG: hypothetical protein KIT27_08950 [Legionellales bacterium]|nr:hypothetical protein [Legionellales bacterium]